MKHILFLFVILTSCVLLGCVQKSIKQKVVFTLDVSQLKDINSVDLRGDSDPLSWDKNTEMASSYKDSIYTATVVFDTGYRFVNVKFLVNGQFELENLPNCRVDFDDDHITEYHAIYDQPIIDTKIK